MPEDSDPDGVEVSTVRSGEGPGDVELYETEDGVVLYDSGNPLAWIESRSPVRLDEAT